MAMKVTSRCACLTIAVVNAIESIRKVVRDASNRQARYLAIVARTASEQNARSRFGRAPHNVAIGDNHCRI
jgi:hypothetical protein